MNRAKSSFVLRFCSALVALVFFCVCATASAAPPVPGLMSLGEALTAAVRAVEAKVPAGTEIAVYEITSQDKETGEFLCEDLFERFFSSGRLIPLPRRNALFAADTEHQFQMSGLVSDESAVGIGHYLGAKVVITGTLDRYTNFSQLRIRAVDVRTGAPVAVSSARVANNDPILTSIAIPSNGVTLPDISESALALLDSGRDLYIEGKLDESIKALTAALVADRSLASAYFYRGNAHEDKGDYDSAIADYSEALRTDLNDSRTTTEGSLITIKGTITEQSRTITKPYELTQIMPLRTTTGVSHTKAKATTTGQLRTITKPCG